MKDTLKAIVKASKSGLVQSVHLEPHLLIWERETGATINFFYYQVAGIKPRYPDVSMSQDLYNLIFTPLAFWSTTVLG